MCDQTPALAALTQAQIRFQTRCYGYDAEAVRKGLQAAAALDLPTESVFKTLMTWVDSQSCCAIIPSHHQLNLKWLAAALKGRRARLMQTLEAENLTGYQIGGISPFGQRAQAPLVLDSAAALSPIIWVNAGQRGLLVALAPHAIIETFGAQLHQVSEAKALRA